MLVNMYSFLLRFGRKSPLPQCRRPLHHPKRFQFQLFQQIQHFFGNVFLKFWVTQYRSGLSRKHLANNVKFCPVHIPWDAVFLRLHLQGFYWLVGNLCFKKVILSIQGFWVGINVVRCGHDGGCFTISTSRSPEDLLPVKKLVANNAIPARAIIKGMVSFS